MAEVQPINTDRSPRLTQHLLPMHSWKELELQTLNAQKVEKKKEKVSYFCIVKGKPQSRF